MLLLFCAVCELASAQNLVPNGSFEKFTSCPGTFTQSPVQFTITGWMPGVNVPDHFHYCSRGDAGVPYNWAGVSEAYEGDGYAGLYLWTEDKDYREFLQCKLTQPLLKDSTYYIEFHYKLSSYSSYSIDRIGLNFSALPDKGNQTHEQIPALQIVHDSAFTRATGMWEAARFEYKAKGTETYLTLGNFFDNETTKCYRLQSRSISEPMLAKASYYYIDHVIVVPKHRIREQLAANVGQGFTTEKAVFNTPYVLKHIQFEFNSAKLEALSFDELDKLADFLLSKSQVKVEVSGHTDDVGDDGYNLILSQKRADSVAAYLISKGVDKQRILTFGYGKNQPLVQGLSVDARTLNRRVEVRFVQ